MSSKTLFILSYDIEDDRRRNKIREFLKDYGYRVQKSVFVFYLDDKVMKDVLEDLSRMMDYKKDRLRLYKICRTCRESIEFQGISEFPEEEDFFIA